MKENVTLSIRGVEVAVLLGWLEEERQERQIVLLDIDLTFATPPKACETDELADTFCYATLIEQIREFVSNRSYKLVEHLSHEIYRFIQSELSGLEQIQMHLTKFPQVKGLTGGVKFSLSNH